MYDLTFLQAPKVDRRRARPAASESKLVVFGGRQRADERRIGNGRQAPYELGAGTAVLLRPLVNVEWPEIRNRVRKVQVPARVARDAVPGIVAFTLNDLEGLGVSNLPDAERPRAVRSIHVRSANDDVIRRVGRLAARIGVGEVRRARSARGAGRIVFEDRSREIACVEIAARVDPHPRGILQRGSGLAPRRRLVRAVVYVGANRAAAGPGA